MVGAADVDRRPIPGGPQQFDEVTEAHHRRPVGNRRRALAVEADDEDAELATVISELQLALSVEVCTTYSVRVAPLKSEGAVHSSRIASFTKVAVIVLGAAA